MIRCMVPILIAAVHFVAATSVEGEEQEHICRFHDRGSAFGIELDGEGRRYAPDRAVDVLHIKLDVTPDFGKRTVSGTTTIRFKPISKPVSELTLDAVHLSVSDVRSEAGIQDRTNTGKQLIISFERPIEVGEVSSLEIDHSAEPTRGLYFRTPEMGYPATDTHVWTQGETHEARFWFPCFDYPNERSTTEVICHVPPDMTVLSNGRRISQQINEESGLKRVHWKQEKPHVNYLICLVAGHFKELKKRHGDVELGFYTQPSLVEHAANSFRDTADIMAYFETEIGMPYPWHKYDQVTIRDFVAGGMENTTLTTLTHRTIFTDETENLRSTRRLDAHELAHQWFGDYVTCKDWSHLWLNEGFATYYAHLYEGHKFGEDAKEYGLYLDAKRRVLPRGDDKRPIVYNAYKNAGEQFDYRAYPKGSWVLHMLRCQLGPDLYRRCILDYLNRHALESVVTDDLRQSFERLSGRTFDRFFDQWVYHAGRPELKISYQWLADEQLAKVTIEQTQQVNEHALLFEFPTKLRFIVGDDVVDRAIVVGQEKEDFFVPLPGQPKIVRFDPEFTVLAKVNFKKSDDLLFAQLMTEDDMVGRLLAAEALASRKTGKSVEHLKTTLCEDQFFGVRIAAAESLGKIHDDAAYEALMASRDQDDARVRMQVVTQLAKFHRPAARRAMADVLESEGNPAIAAVAIKAFGRYSDKKSRALTAKYLTSDSFRNELADAAIEAVRMRRDARDGGKLMKAIQEREEAFTSRGLSAAFRALATVRRSKKKRHEEREFLTVFLNHPKERIRVGAIQALGDLGDRSAIAVLEPLVVDDGPPSRVAEAAKAALKRIQSESNSAPAEVVELRKAITDLKEDNEKLRREFDELKKKLESKGDQPQQSPVEVAADTDAS